MESAGSAVSAECPPWWKQAKGSRAAQITHTRGQVGRNVRMADSQRAVGFQVKLPRIRIAPVNLHLDQQLSSWLSSNDGNRRKEARRALQANRQREEMLRSVVLGTHQTDAPAPA